MALLIAFILGVANFAAHGAVLSSRHPMLETAPWFVHLLGGRISLATEFLLLLAALLLTAQGWGWATLAYAGYSALNAIGAWLILTRRV